MAKRNQVAKPVVRYALLIALTIWTLGPVTWLVSLAFKPPLEWYTSNLIPREPIIDNFIWIFNTTNPIGKTSVMTAVAEPVMKPFLNSIVVSSLGTVFAVLVGFLAAYGVSRYRAGGTFTLFFTLLTRMLPGAVFITPLLIYYSTLRILDTHFGLIVLYTAVTLTYSIWILKGFIDEIPPEYEEAALLEGASPWSILSKVVVPLLKGGILTSALFIFILNWTELLFAIVLTDIRAVTLPYQIGRYVSAVGILYGPQAALGLIATIPSVAIGYIIQKHLVTGFTFGRVR